MMRLVVHNPLNQIHWFVNYLFGFSIIVQKNRMIQIASCVLALIQMLFVFKIFYGYSSTSCKLVFQDTGRAGN